MSVLISIKNALKKAGIPEKYAAKVQALFNIENEENIDNYVSLFKDNILPDLQAAENVAEKVKQTAISEYEKQHGLKDGKPIVDPKKEKDAGEGGKDDDFGDLSPAVVKLLKDQQRQISELTASVSSVASTLTTSTKLSSAKEVFANSKLPEKWFVRIDVNSGTSVEEQIKNLEEEYAEIKQSVIDEEVAGGAYKPNAHQPKERTEKEWLDFMNTEEGAGESNGVATLE